MILIIGNARKDKSGFMKIVFESMAGLGPATTNVQLYVQLSTPLFRLQLFLKKKNNLIDNYLLWEHILVRLIIFLDYLKYIHLNTDCLIRYIE